MTSGKDDDLERARDVIPRLRADQFVYQDGLADLIDRLVRRVEIAEDALERISRLSGGPGPRKIDDYGEIAKEALTKIRTEGK